MSNLTIICPCYNEEKNIKDLYLRFQEVHKLIPIKVIFINNGSYDGTAAELSRLANESEFAQVIHLKENLGYGGGILHGLNKASTDFIGWTHADLQTNPLDIVSAYNILKNRDFDSNLFIKGRRKNRPLLDTSLSFGMSLFETILFGKIINEVNAQPTIFHRDFLKTWINPPSDFSLDLYSYVVALKNKLNIIKFDVKFLSRTHGSSKWNNGPLSILRFIYTTLKFSFSLRIKYFLK